MTDAVDRPLPPSLPAQMRTRPLTLDDAYDVFTLMAACELHDVGTVEIEEADIVADWQRPSADVASCSIGVLEGDTLVGYAELIDTERYDAAVHPDHRRRGIGTVLAGWIREIARARGASVVGMPVPEGSDGDRLLAALGYHVRWTSWVLRLPAGAQVAPRGLPDGYALRTATPADHPQIHAVVEAAFGEWSDRERSDIADFAAGVWQRPGFEPWHLQVVTDPDGRVVAASHSWNTGEGDETDTYVSKLAVARDHRGRGFAQALLVAAFAAGRAHGAATSSLSTDSRTGALGLYEKVGMRPVATWVHRGIAL